MTAKFSAIVLAAAVGASLAVPAAAQSREQRQMMADLRILQEQTQLMQNLINQLSQALEAVNGRLDDQANASRKAFADQKLIIDTLSNDLRVVREKVDDNNVRIGSLTQELELVRRAVAQMSVPPGQTTDAGAPPAAAAGTSASGAPAESAPAPPPALGTSPQRAWDTAFSDYAAGQYDLAVLGFEAYIRDFPTSDRADNAQVYVGKALIMDSKYDKAVEAFESVIRNYPTGDAIAEAYYQKGLALQHLGDNDKAREAWDTVIKQYPETTPATLAKQKLPELKKPE